MIWKPSSGLTVSPATSERPISPHAGVQEQTGGKPPKSARLSLMDVPFRDVRLVASMAAPKANQPLRLYDKPPPVRIRGGAASRNLGQVGAPDLGGPVDHQIRSRYG